MIFNLKEVAPVWVPRKHTSGESNKGMIPNEYEILEEKMNLLLLWSV